jgi:catechol 2,3-dioxygenase-like lactoylglutathione lyase family enzyme
VPRGIDHLVLAVRDLESARDTYRRLGFTLTPEARHPFGTRNSLVQLDGQFLELVAIGDAANIPEASASVFSFAAFNRDFLARREGLSMLVLRSDDTFVTHAELATAGLRTYDPVPFERVARGPDGSERKVAFTMDFVSDPRIEDAAFFTCQHHHPENFWRAEFQRHANGARGVESVIMVADDPASYGAFLVAFSGAEAHLTTPDGVFIDTGRGRVELLTPAAASAVLGGSVEGGAPRFIAYRIGTDDLAKAATALRAGGIGVAERGRFLIVPAQEALGVAVIFSEWPLPARSL